MAGRRLWRVRSRSPRVDRLGEETGLPPLLAQVLINRGVRSHADVSAYLEPRLAELCDPFLLKDMLPACDAVMDALLSRRRIVIYGDYDADGITATALLIHFFRDLGIPVSYYIPHRLQEGYGLNPSALARLAGLGPSLLITVDCGSSDVDTIRSGRQMGLDFVVTDHHQVPEGPLPSCPVINPQRPGSCEDWRGLSGVGVAFCLAVALRSRLRKHGWFRRVPEPDLRPFLDLVALGTIADRSPVDRQNRILVKHGLQIMGATRWEGLRALMEVSGIGKNGLTAADVGYRLAPRLNAVGRLDSAEPGIRALIARSPQAAKRFALALDRANRERQDLERAVLEQAVERARRGGSTGGRSVLVVEGEGWHPGVLGIVASRLVERYHRPVFVFSTKDGITVGSGRSVGGFDMVQNLRKIAHLFDRYGGHSHAAGLTLKAERVSEFALRVCDLAEDCIGPEPSPSPLDVDASIGLRQWDMETVRSLQALAPFGEKNPEPLFCSMGVRVVSSRLVGDGHLVLGLEDGETFEGIGFRMADLRPMNGERVNVAYTPEINTWAGRERVQLRIVDFHPAGMGDDLVLFEDPCGQFDVLRAEHE